MSESAYAYEEASFVCLPVGITDNHGTVGIAKKPTDEFFGCPY